VSAATSASSRAHSPGAPAPVRGDASVGERDVAGTAATACRLVRTPADFARHFAVRRAVFVAEQALFEGDDRDGFDDRASTLHALATAGGRSAGAVRLYPLEPPGLWRGDRLAVLPEFRHGLLGAALVEFAVRSAGERGGARMVAMIQLPNVRFFEALGWRAYGSAQPFHGRDHQPMEIILRGR
jgi:putative N-acetyltransferase (TIGR04045 family)